MDGGSEGVPEGLYILERLASNALHSYMKSFRTSSSPRIMLHPSLVQNIFIKSNK